MKKPNFFLIGPPRSGTTALWSYLKQHPEIYMPTEHKELRYFTKDLHSDRGTLNSYLYWFKDVKNEKCIGESTPFYLYSKTASKEIKTFSPNDGEIYLVLYYFSETYLALLNLQYMPVSLRPHYTTPAAAWKIYLKPDRFWLNRHNNNQLLLQYQQ